jgi:hypothetical protein
MKRLVTLAMVAAFAGVSGDTIAAFCGFYVAKGDSKLFNRASRVVLARDGDRTVLTMSSDFSGDVKEFALVVPVPTFIRKDQIHVANQALVDHLDAYSAPRLVEYYDDDPCARISDMVMPSAPLGAGMRNEARERSLGVTVEAKYTIDEYDIVILSAEESSGLQTWLRQSGYRIPEGADAVLGSYIRQNMRFFVARVNLTEYARLGFTYLRPLQIAYESPKFMLPIRLGTVNADGAQDLFVFGLTRKGRIETTNYRTVRLPSDAELPAFVKQDFGDFYRAMFTDQVRRERMSTVFLEYAWDMGWCDPCAADPLSVEELRTLGVFWLDQGPPSAQPGRPMRNAPTPADVFVTRLHARYDAVSFPEDLVFQETGDRSNFQGRYILRHPWSGRATCPAAREYERQVRLRQEVEARTLARLTGWRLEDIRRRLTPLPGAEPQPEPRSWWQRLWP